MGLHSGSYRIKYLPLAAGALGFFLRALLYTTGTDDSGLLVRDHWAATALLILSGATFIGILLPTRRIKGSDSCFVAFPASPAGALGCAAAAAAFFLSPVPDTVSSSLFLTETVLRFAAGICLLVIGFYRLRGRQPSFLLYATLCLYLAVRLICRYRIWSVDPQLQNYCYHLGAYITLMLTTYQFAAFHAGLGNHRKLWGFGLSAVYLCTVSLRSDSEPLLMACCGFWILTNLSHFTTKEQEKYA